MIRFYWNLLPRKGSGQSAGSKLLREPNHGETSPNIRDQPLPLWAGSPVDSFLASKMLPALRREHDFRLFHPRSSCHVFALGLLLASFGCSGESLGLLLRALGCSCGSLGGFFGVFGVSWGVLGALLVSLWVILGVTWGLLDHRWRSQIDQEVRLRALDGFC